VVKRNAGRRALGAESNKYSLCLCGEKGFLFSLL